MAHRRDAHEAHMGQSGEVGAGKVATTVLHMGGLNWASEKAVVERVLGHEPGVGIVEANPVSQTATVTFDTARTSVAELRRWVEECGYHCAGQSVPSHVCDPMAEPDPVDGNGAVPAAPWPAGTAVEHGGHEVAAGEGMPSAREMMGPRRCGWHVDGGHGRRHAQPLPGGGGAVGADPAVVADRAQRAGLHGRRAVRPAR